MNKFKTLPVLLAVSALIFSGCTEKTSEQSITTQIITEKDVTLVKEDMITETETTMPVSESNFDIESSDILTLEKINSNFTINGVSVSFPADVEMLSKVYSVEEVQEGDGAGRTYPLYLNGRFAGIAFPSFDNETETFGMITSYVFNLSYDSDDFSHKVSFDKSELDFSLCGVTPESSCSDVLSCLGNSGIVSDDGMPVEIYYGNIPAEGFSLMSITVIFDSADPETARISNINVNLEK